MNPQTPSIKSARPKPAVQSQTIIGIIATVALTFGTLLASYDATGQVSMAELITASSALLPAFYAIRGRFNANRPLSGWF